jgi:hypothetical protein
MARFETRQPPLHPPCLVVTLLPSAAVVIGSLLCVWSLVTMRRAVLCPVLDAAQRTQTGPSHGPASHASVTTADHVSAGDCASMSIVTRGVAGVAAFAGAACAASAPSLHVSAGLGPGCAPSKFRPSPADPCCCCSRCHRTRPLPSLLCPFQNSVLCPPALPSLRACLSAAPSVCHNQTLAPLSPPTPPT